MSTPTRSWSRGPISSRSIRALFYVFYGSFGGFLVALVAGLGYVLLRVFRLRGASYETLGVGVFLVGSFVLLRLAEMVLIVDAGRRTNLHWTIEEFADASSRRWRAVWVAVGAIGQCALFLYSTTFWALAFLGISIASIGAAELLSSTGDVDPETRTLQYDEKEIDLNPLTGVRRIQTDRWTVLWLSFARGRTTHSTPHLLVLPTATFENVSDVFNAGLAREVEPRRGGRILRGVFFVTGLLLLGAAVGIFALVSGGGAGIVAATTFACIFGLFAFPFLRLALFD